MGGKTAQTADFRIISGICQLTSSTSRLRRPRRPGPPPAWSPQRDSNPRPTDSRPPPFSRPPRLRGLGPGLSLRRVGARAALGGWCKVSTLPPRRRRPGVARDCHPPPAVAAGFGSGFPVLATSTPRVSPRRCNHSQISCSRHLSYAGSYSENVGKRLDYKDLAPAAASRHAPNGKRAADYRGRKARMQQKNCKNFVIPEGR